MLIRPRALLLVVPVVASYARTCYAQPCLNANDFQCFLNKWSAGDPSANCDGSTTAPALNANDFQCFLNRFAAGSPYADCDGSCLPPDAGWTDLTPVAGASVFYVSASGSDANPGTVSLPFRTLARGYQALRSGFGDQLLLRRGDTWAEGVTWTKNRTVLASYGTAAARPRVQVAGTAFYSSGVSDSWFIDLEVVCPTPTSSSAGFCFFTPSSRNRIEGCLISGFAVNIVMQETDGAVRATGNVIHRCVIVDSNEPGSGHSQGGFFGNQDGLTITECVSDRNAINKSDIFCHNWYLHQTCGPSTFRDNISIRACSHGVQQRSGGVMENCLFLQSPINAYQGTGPGVNRFIYNVAVDSDDVNSVDRRGQYFVLGANPGSVAEHNVAAHNEHGSWPIGFVMDGWSGGSFRDNVAYDLSAPGHEGWATAVQWDSGGGACVAEGNWLVMFDHGVLWRHEGRGTSGITYRNNRYYTNNPFGGYGQFQASAGAGLTFDQWQLLVGDSGSTFAFPAVKDGTVGAYLVSCGVPPGPDPVATFAGLARAQRKGAWDARWTADAVNDWERAVFGVSPN